MSKPVRVGAVQAEPVWLDLQGSIDKTISLIKQAGKDGIDVLGFPEVWVPGYPWQDPLFSSSLHYATRDFNLYPKQTQSWSYSN
jgi:predicted amidohydrolase